MDKPLTLHGNKARVDPKKKLTGAYETNPVTASRRKEGEPPAAVDEQNADRAREFSQENQQ